jgi:hypothetical protein
MLRFRKWAATLVATLSVVTIVLLLTGWGSAVASNAAATLNVLVANTSANPVPVQATGTLPVHEQGTANVNVTNTVPVSGSVGITGTPSVSLSGTPTVKTTAVDNPAFQPVEVEGSVVDGSDTTIADKAIYTVPAGKELVIQQVQMQSVLPSGEHVIESSIATVNSTQLGRPTFYRWIVPETTAVVDTFGTDWIGAIQTTLYADPGTNVAMRCRRSDTTGTSNGVSVTCDFSGYLVSLPS